MVNSRDNKNMSGSLYSGFARSVPHAKKKKKHPKSTPIFLFSLLFCLLCVSASFPHRMHDHVCQPSHVQGRGGRGEDHEVSHPGPLPSEVDRTDVHRPLPFDRLHHLFHREVRPEERSVRFRTGASKTRADDTNKRGSEGASDRASRAGGGFASKGEADGGVQAKAWAVGVQASKAGRTVCKRTHTDDPATQRPSERA